MKDIVEELRSGPRIGMNNRLFKAADEIEKLRYQLGSAKQALEFYRDEAEALSRNMRLGKSGDAIMASLTVLSLDAGTRANVVLLPDETKP